jgi:hypothetical protein
MGNDCTRFAACGVWDVRTAGTGGGTDWAIELVLDHQWDEYECDEFDERGRTINRRHFSNRQHFK